jgi:hypothetical protein
MSNAIASRNHQNSYVDHIIHIQNIPNPEQIQYMNYTHAVALTFNKDKKCNLKYIIILLFEI